jgi:hypothetical protein
MRVALWMNPLWRLVSKAAPSEAGSRKRRSERAPRCGHEGGGRSSVRRTVTAGQILTYL